MDTETFHDGCKTLLALESSKSRSIRDLTKGELSALSAAAGYWRAVWFILRKGVIERDLILTLHLEKAEPGLLAEHYVSAIERNPSWLKREPVEVLVSHFLDGLNDENATSGTGTVDSRSLTFSIRGISVEETN